MCYFSLVTSHPVILGIQLHHSLDNLTERTQQLIYHSLHHMHPAQVYQSINAVVVTCCTSKLLVCIKCKTNTPHLENHSVTPVMPTEWWYYWHNPMIILIPSYLQTVLKNPRISYRPRGTQDHLCGAQWKNVPKNMYFGVWYNCFFLGLSSRSYKILSLSTILTPTSFNNIKKNCFLTNPHLNYV
jgi:hypothetical protein